MGGTSGALLQPVPFVLRLPPLRAFRWRTKECFPRQHFLHSLVQRRPVHLQLRQNALPKRAQQLRAALLARTRPHGESVADLGSDLFLWKIFIDLLQRREKQQMESVS